MSKYKPLKFMELFEIIETVDAKTGELEKLKDVIENNYNDVLEFNKLTGRWGKITINLKIEPDVGEQIKVSAEVAKTFQKIKNEIKLQKNQDGKLFLDNPDQQVLDGVHPVGTTSDKSKK